MLPRKESDFRDWVALLRRHARVMVAIVLIATAAGYGGSFAVRNRYTSQTLVLVEGDRVADNIANPVVASDVGDRLTTIKEQIQSRTRLQSIIEQYRLYPEAYGRVPMEKLVEWMRESIRIEPLNQTRKPGIAGFYLSFTAFSPKLAQQVCLELSTMFLRENVHGHQERVDMTTDFLESHLSDAKQALAVQEKRLSEFKERYLGQLPDQRQTTLSMLGTLTGQLAAADQEVTRAQQQKDYTEALLAEELAKRKASGMLSSSDELRDRIEKLKAQMATLEGRYTPDHPDVIRTRRELSELQSQLADVDAPRNDAASTDEPNSYEGSQSPQIQRLRIQLKHLQHVIELRSAEQERLNREIQTYRSRLQLSPSVEAELNNLNRDYETAMSAYNSLLAKNTQSEQAKELEAKYDQGLFRIVDAPNLPQHPSFPKRWMFAVGGLIAGVVLGLIVTLIRELRDTALRTEHDVLQYLGHQVLAAVPVAKNT